MDYASSTGPPKGFPHPQPLGDAIFDLAGSDFVPGPPWASEHLLVDLVVFEDVLKKDVKDAWIDFLESKTTDEATGVVLAYANKELTAYQLVTFLIEDVLLAGYALVFIAICIVLHTGSLFLTLAGILNMVLAWPYAYFMYASWFKYTELSILTPVTLLVCLGIGVDDIFVFVDTFKQTDTN